MCICVRQATIELNIQASSCTYAKAERRRWTIRGSLEALITGAHSTDKWNEISRMSSNLAYWTIMFEYRVASCSLSIRNGNSKGKSSNSILGMSNRSTAKEVC